MSDASRVIAEIHNGIHINDIKPSDLDPIDSDFPPIWHGDPVTHRSQKVQTAMAISPTRAEGLINLEQHRLNSTARQLEG